MTARKPCDVKLGLRNPLQSVAFDQAHHGKACLAAAPWRGLRNLDIDRGVA